MAFISKSNCEYELSGRMSKSSFKSSFGSIGDVGGVVNWLDCIDDLDGDDDPFNGLDSAGAFASLVDPDE